MGQRMHGNVCDGLGARALSLAASLALAASLCPATAIARGGADDLAAQAEEAAAAATRAEEVIPVTSDTHVMTSGTYRVTGDVTIGPDESGNGIRIEPGSRVNLILSVGSLLNVTGADAEGAEPTEVTFYTYRARFTDNPEVTCVSGHGVRREATDMGKLGDGQTQDMFRLYNPNSGEHFYTGEASERDHLVEVGWTDEGVGWVAPADGGSPVYRLYNRNGGEHHFTTDDAERDALIDAGWTDEGVGWYSDPDESVPLYREYNPNKFACNHNYTVDTEEHERLLSLGWRDEGVAWYGVAAE